ncbi:hypothetical protein ACD583_21450 [Xanthomonas campestris pv. campestris]|uniref:hypothetical protein n=1 Tax=Xanthomonas campestris TaxID=339 RepID=UPI0025A0E4B0|nr:hypothetical protein [Xanthomonas campestris]MDM7731230.1 hypothetical protein [Xanthomonas campestris pv. campestris]
MEYLVQYRYSRVKWVNLSSHATRNEARDAAAERIAALVQQGFKHADLARDFRVRGVTVSEAA